MNRLSLLAAASFAFASIASGASFQAPSAASVVQSARITADAVELSVPAGELYWESAAVEGVVASQRADLRGSAFSRVHAYCQTQGHASVDVLETRWAVGFPSEWEEGADGSSTGPARAEADIRFVCR